MVHVARDNGRVGLEPRNAGKRHRGSLSFQPVGEKDYESHIHEIFLKKQDPWKSLSSRELHRVDGQIQVDFEVGYVVLQGATVAYVRKGSRFCWLAEMDVKELVWNDASAEEAG